jgi:hypothetical protein
LTRSVSATTWVPGTAPGFHRRLIWSSFIRKSGLIPRGLPRGGSSPAQENVDVYSRALSPDEDMPALRRRLRYPSCAAPRKARGNSASCKGKPGDPQQGGAGSSSSRYTTYSRMFPPPMSWRCSGPSGNLPERRFLARHRKEDLAGSHD